MKSLFYDKHFGDSKKWKEGKNEEKRTVDVGETSVSIGVITERAGILEVIKYPQIYTNSGIWLVQLIEDFLL